MKLHLPAAKLYVDEAGRLRTPMSVRGFLRTMANMQGQYPHHHVEDFSPSDLTTFCLSGPNPSPNTIRTRKSHVSPFFEWATWKRLVPANPALDLKWTVRPGNGTRRPKIWLNDEDIAALTPPTDDFVEWRDRMLVLIPVMTGLRLNELATLTWDMLDREFAVLSLRRKGGKLSNLPVPEQLREELLQWRAQAPADAVAVFPRLRWAWKDGERQMVTIWHKPLGGDGIRDRLREVSQRAEIEFRPHDLRRSFAGKLDAMGYQIQVIQKLMDHESSATTDRYLKDNPARKAEAIEGLQWSL